MNKILFQSITGIRPILTNVSPSSNTNLLTGQQSDSILQRTFLSPSTTTGLQQPQIITVNQQPIRTEIRTNQIQIQQRTILRLVNRSDQFEFFVFDRNEDDSADDTLGNNGLLTTSSGPIDDRHARHITHDNRFLPSNVLRRRLDHLGND